MGVPESLRAELLGVIPSLRAFATSLVGTADRADDLVQETLARALQNIASFRPGTNLRAWTFTILRNEFYSSLRRTRREVADPDGSYARRLTAPPEQMGHLDMEDFRRALSRLPDSQREALILVGASGFSYEEAAEICGVAVGTVKSRVSRARVQLEQLLHFGRDGSAEADRFVEAAARDVAGAG